VFQPAAEDLKRESPQRASTELPWGTVHHFRRRQKRQVDEHAATSSLRQAEENPELLAAESAVNRLPPPPPTSGPYVGMIGGAPPKLVGFPGEDDPA
jgi:hypothetical protein